MFCSWLQLRNSHVCVSNYAQFSILFNNFCESIQWICDWPFLLHYPWSEDWHLKQYYFLLTFHIWYGSKIFCQTVNSIKYFCCASQIFLFLPVFHFLHLVFLWSRKYHRSLEWPSELLCSFNFFRMEAWWVVFIDPLGFTKEFCHFWKRSIHFCYSLLIEWMFCSQYHHYHLQWAMDF